MHGNVVEHAQHRLRAGIAGRGESRLQVAPADLHTDASRHLPLGVEQFPAGRQGEDLRGPAQPLAGQLVAGHQLPTILAEYHQRHRRGLDQGPAERVALDELLVRPMRGMDDAARVPAQAEPAAQDERRNQQQAGQQPLGMAKETGITDTVDREPAACGLAAQLNRHPVAGEVQAVAKPFGRRLAHQQIALRRNQAVRVKHRTLHQLLEIVDPPQVEQTRGNDQVVRLIPPPQGFRQIDPDDSQQFGRLPPIAVRAHPMHRVVGGARRRFAQARQHAVDHHRLVLAQPLAFRHGVDRRHGQAGTAGKIVDQQLWRGVCRKAPEAAVEVGEQDAQGERPPRRIPVDPVASGQEERHGKGKFPPLIDLDTFFPGQEPPLQGHHVMVVLLRGLVAFACDAHEEGLVFPYVADQPGEVEGNLVLFFLEQSPQRPVADAEQQYGQYRHAEQPDVQAPRDARPLEQQLVVMFQDTDGLHGMQFPPATLAR